MISIPHGGEITTYRLSFHLLTAADVYDNITKCDQGNFLPFLGSDR
jgi:hypothetical protein